MQSKQKPPKKSKIRLFLQKITEQVKSFLKLIPIKKVLLGLIGLTVILVVVLSFFQTRFINQYYDARDLIAKEEANPTNNAIMNYTNAKLSYIEDGLTYIPKDEAFESQQLSGLKVDVNDPMYGSIVSAYHTLMASEIDVHLLDESNDITIEVGGLQEGLYNLALDYYELSDLIDANQISIKINGENPYYESQTLVLPSHWVFDTTEFSLDRYKNEIHPQSHKEKSWMHHQVSDVKGLHEGLFLFPLKANDVITISFVNTYVLIGQVYLTYEEGLLTYDEYLTINQAQKAPATKLEVSARELLRRSDPSIRLRADQDPSHTYYDTQFLKLNVIFSESWQNGGQSVTYKVNAPFDGYYELSVKYRQNLMKDIPVFRKVKIDGKVPFDLLNAYAFPFTLSFVNRTLTDEDGKPLSIYLTKGDHEITFEAVLYPYRFAIEKIRGIMSEIQDLALEVKRYTAGGTDPYRDWDIADYFPNAKDDMLRWSNELTTLHSSMMVLASSNNPGELVNLKVAAERLKFLASDINRLPSRMVQFSDGDSSVNTLIGGVMQRLLTAGLEIEKIFVASQTNLPDPYANIFVSLWEGTKRLVLSFVNNPYSASARRDDELTVWVNHPRQYIEIMQAMVDAQYQGNLKVTLSQMPDQNKLILANASGQSPDLAIGVDHWIPYDFALRDASLDLRQFNGYSNVVSKFSKGAVIPYVFEEGVYGLPETQNFWVTYYRRDILESIGITHIPETWEQIIEILPLLQSYGLNYFIPLAQYTGLKPFVATLPFIYQFGGDLYTENGMQTAINSEETLKGITLMSNLFTLYNLPKYVASFYNQFRYGTLPIGISDLSTYLLLQTAAKELDGLWGMALHPGYYDESKGEIVRYSASGAQSSMILSTTKHKEEAWNFLSWWMSTPVQSEFAFTLQSTYGKAYLWNTANLEAFATVSMPVNYRSIILEQWNYAIEASRIPGAYMVEREISNAWTNIVFNGMNPRQALDQAVRVSNREILYKMAEVGYVKDGQILKPYPVPSIYNIDNWLEEYD